MRKSKHSFTGTPYFEEERADIWRRDKEANGSYDIAQRRTTDS